MIKLRTPPADTVMEHQLLASIIIDPSCLPAVREWISPAHFTKEETVLIYKIITKITAENGHAAIDASTVFSNIPEPHKTEMFDYLDRMLSTVASAANAVYYARRINEKYIERELACLVQHGAAMLDDHSLSAQEKIENLASMAGLARNFTTEVAQQTVADLIGKLSQDLTGEGMRPISTGLNAIDHQIEGLGAGQLILVAGATSMGKAQPYDSKVLTASGWKTISSLEKGERIFSSDGILTRVEEIYPQGKKEIYKITMSDGGTTYCTEEHLWRVSYGKGRKTESTKSLKEIQVDYKLSGGRNKYTIPRNKAIKLPAKELAIPPYLMGFFLGDGWYRSNVMFYIRKNKLPAIKKLLPPDCELIDSGTPNNYRVRKKKSGKRPASLALCFKEFKGKRSWEKYIPKHYLYAGNAQRRELLQGLLDTDGYAANKNWYEYSTSSKHLADNVKWLVQSLGGHCNYIKRKGRYKKNGEYFECRDNYRLFITFKSRNIRWRYIHNIEKAGVKDCQCIRIANASGLYITDDFIVTHNTSLLLDMFIHTARIGQRPYYYYLEMLAVHLAQRLVMNIARVPKEMVDPTFPAIRETQIIVENWPAWIEQKPSANIGNIINQISAKKSRDGIGVVFIDHIQKIQAPGRGTVEQLSYISNALSLTACELKIPVVCACHVNRETLNRDNHVPKLSDLRGSGSLENDSDVVMIVHREDYYREQKEENPDLDGVALVYVLKNRHGKKGIAKLVWLPEYCSFDDMAQL